MAAIPPLVDPLSPQPNFARSNEHHQQMNEHHQALSIGHQTHSTELSNFRNIPAFTAGDQTIAGLARLTDTINQRLNGIDQRLNGIDRRVNGIDQRVNGIDRRLNGIDRRLNTMQNGMHTMYTPLLRFI